MTPVKNSTHTCRCIRCNKLFMLGRRCGCGETRYIPCGIKTFTTYELTIEEEKAQVKKEMAL